MQIERRETTLKQTKKIIIILITLLDLCNYTLITQVLLFLKNKINNNNNNWSHLLSKPESLESKIMMLISLKKWIALQGAIIIEFSMKCSLPRLKLNFLKKYVCYVHIILIESLIKSQMKPSSRSACAERPLGGALPWKTLIWEAGESCTRLELPHALLTSCWQG